MEPKDFLAALREKKASGEIDNDAVNKHIAELLHEERKSDAAVANHVLTSIECNSRLNEALSHYMRKEVPVVGDYLSILDAMADVYISLYALMWGFGYPEDAFGRAVNIKTPYFKFNEE